ncbi:Transcriptional regulatory protein FixJ [Candidatus Terasakiella magnetica]|nr:Transcriptional regulatory protein FixJ [Candidatus Terasakiella magnetica]
MTTSSVVHIVDDDEAIRGSLSMLLDAAGHETATYADAEIFLAQADLTGQGCVVADVRMPGMSGLELLRMLRSRDIDLPLIVITGHGDIAMAVSALKAGAADFIEKPFDDTLFLNSVNDALDRGRQTFRERRQRASIETRLATLTPREREVMALVVQGLPNKAAAVELAISVRTVEIHRARVMEKMAAESLSELVRMALILEEESSLVRLPHPPSFDEG